MYGIAHCFFLWQMQCAHCLHCKRLLRTAIAGISTSPNSKPLLLCSEQKKKRGTRKAVPSAAFSLLLPPGKENCKEPRYPILLSRNQVLKKKIKEKHQNPDPRIIRTLAPYSYYMRGPRNPGSPKHQPRPGQSKGNRATVPWPGWRETPGPALNAEWIPRHFIHRTSDFCTRAVTSRNAGGRG